MRLLLLLPLVLCSSACPALFAAADLGSWPAEAAPELIGRRVTERFLATPHTNFNRPTPPTIVTYPEVCTWYGALNFSRLTKNQPLAAALIKRFEPIFGDEAKLIPPVTNVDYAVFGALPLQLAIETGEKRYLELGLGIARAQWAAPAPEELSKLASEPRAIAEQAMKDGLTWHTRYWIDDMFMITLLQAQAYRASGEADFIDRTAREMVSYLDRMQQSGGLFHHAPDVPFFWARGNGWFAAGMTELLSSLPESHPLRPRVLDGYRKMMAALLLCQGSDGMWRQLLDKPESWPESSGTAMFTFAFITGVKRGWLDEKSFGPSARRAWLALVTYLDADANLREVCEGTNKLNDYQYYLDRKRVTGDLHGQAPVLWCVNALLR